MTRFKIVEYKNEKGENYFKIKERILFIFWDEYGIKFETLKSAKERIDYIINGRKENKKSKFKIFKKHKYNGPLR